MRCLPSSLLFFFLAMCQFDWRLPKIEGSILNCTVPRFWPTYIGERRTPFSKAYGIKVRRYGKNIGNPLGTWKEHSANTLGSREKLKRKSLSPPLPAPHPPQNIKGKKERHLEWMLGPSHWLHEISLPKRLCHHFWHGLITPLAKNTPPIIQCWGTFDV
jgi:hypothetical protein